MSSSIQTGRVDRRNGFGSTEASGVAEKRANGGSIGNGNGNGNGSALKKEVEGVKRYGWRAWSVKWEVPRKLLHSSIGFIAVHGWLNDTSPPPLVLYLSGALTIIVSADLLRFRSKPFARLYETLLGFLMRPSERSGWNGVIFYLLGVIIVLTTLPRDIAVLSVLILSWCDTAASTVGRRYGKHTPKLPCPPFARQKSLAGFLGAFVVGSIVSAFFWSTLAAQNAQVQDLSWAGARSVASGNWSRGPETVVEAFARWAGWSSKTWEGQGQLGPPRSTMSLPVLSGVCGLVAAVAESLDVWGFDDNMTLPVLSGWGIWLVMRLAG